MRDPTTCIAEPKQSLHSTIMILSSPLRKTTVVWASNSSFGAVVTYYVRKERCSLDAATFSVQGHHCGCLLLRRDYLTAPVHWFRLLRDCNPDPVLSIPGFWIGESLIPGSRRDY